MASGTSTLPKHLEELAQPTPSGIKKLIAAWPDLTTETQILLLHTIAKSDLTGHLFDKIAIIALESNNPYIRYLIAKQMYFNDEDSEKNKIKEKIRNDSDPLVKYSIDEKNDLGSLLGFDEVEFFTFPHEKRLAIIREVTGDGEEFAKAITFAVEKKLPTKEVTEVEIYELISDYIRNGKLIDYYERGNPYDGYGQYSNRKGLEALWKLVLIVHEETAYELIKHLPEVVDDSSCIPKKVLDGMNNRQLLQLLYRRDIKLSDFRKEIFKTLGQDREYVKQAAISHNINLEHSEFKEILSLPDKEKVGLLKGLGFANDLDLCTYDAIHDALWVANVSPLGADFEDAIYARDALERNIKELTGWQRKKQLLELRLYRLAKTAVPWQDPSKDEQREGYPPEGKLEFLKESIVEKDTWATFMNFLDTWSRSFTNENLEKHLPRIDELDEEFDESIWEEEEANISHEHDEAIEKKCQSILDSVREIDDKTGDIVGDLAELVAESHRKLEDRVIHNSILSRDLQSSIETILIGMRIIFVGILAVIIIIIFF